MRMICMAVQPRRWSSKTVPAWPRSQRSLSSWRALRAAQLNSRFAIAGRTGCRVVRTVRAAGGDTTLTPRFRIADTQPHPHQLRLDAAAANAEAGSGEEPAAGSAAAGSSADAAPIGSATMYVGNMQWVRHAVPRAFLSDPLQLTDNGLGLCSGRQTRIWRTLPALLAGYAFVVIVVTAYRVPSLAAAATGSKHLHSHRRKQR
jgi:hypothetical protein